MNAKQGNDTHPNNPVIHVAPSPHVFNMGMTIHGMMRDVIIALAPWWLRRSGFLAGQPSCSC